MSGLGAVWLPLPLVGEGWGEGTLSPSGGGLGGPAIRRGQAAVDLFAGFCVVTFCCGVEVGGRGVRPAAQSPSFAPPKERNPRKGGPTCRVPALRSGQPAVLDRGAALRNSLCSLRSHRSNNRSESELEERASCSALSRPSLCAPRHVQRGGKAHSGHRCARPWVARTPSKERTRTIKLRRHDNSTGVRPSPQHLERDGS